MPKHPSVSLARFLCGLSLVGAAAHAQNSATVPPAMETLPGNAGMAMPLRWSEGKLQVFIDAPLLPDNFIGETITGLRLRRSVLPGAVAYPAMTRTITVYGAFQGPPAANMIAGWLPNRPTTGYQTLFGPAVVNIPATPAPGPGTTVGEELVQIVFTTPLPVTAGTLYLEFETTDGPLQVDPGNWVDAVWFGDGVEAGYVTIVGDGSCTTRSQPTELRETSNSDPVAGDTLNLRVTGAPPTVLGQVGFVLCWVGLDPETRAPGPGNLGYGASLGAIDPLMVDCFQWAPLDVAWFGPTDGAGAFNTTLDIPAGAVVGQRLGIQAGWLDTSRPVLPISFSNGLQIVCNSLEIGDRCNSFFFPGDVAVSPWGPQIGQVPVIILDY